MKVIFDIDGTLTDYNKYVKDKALGYFERKYGMKVKFPDELEIEDIFTMDEFFAKKQNCSEIDAKKYTAEALDKYWFSYRLVRFFLYPFRSGVKAFINTCKSRGYTLEIHSSRDKTAEKSLAGAAARILTYFQFAVNGVFLSPKKFRFYRNDTEKTAGILKSKPDVVFDDKPLILETLRLNSIKTVCVRGRHNKQTESGENVKILRDFKEAERCLSP